MGTMSTVASHTSKPHHLSLPGSLHFLPQLSEEGVMTTSLQHERLRSRTCVLPPHILCAFLYRHTPKLLPCCCHWSALAQPHKPFERHLKKNTKNKLHIAMHGGRLSSQWRRVVEEASLLRTIYYETTSSTGLVPSPLGVCCASILAKGCLYLDIRRTSHYTLERQSFFIWPDWQVEQPSGSLSLPLQSLCLSYLPKPSSSPFPPLSKSSNYLPYSSCHRPVLPAACRASHQPLPLLAFDSIYAGGEACDFWDIWEIDRSTDHQIPQPVKLLKSNTVEIVGP